MMDSVRNVAVLIAGTDNPRVVADGVVLGLFAVITLRGIAIPVSEHTVSTLVATGIAGQLTFGVLQGPWFSRNSQV